MISLKTEKDILEIKECTGIAKKVMNTALNFVKPGITTLELDNFIYSQIKANKATSSFFGVYGYKYSSCISINEEIVHGVPRNRKIKNGDVVSVDLGVKFKGWNSDFCRTVIAGKEGKKGSFAKEKNFLEIGFKTLDLAINKCRHGNFVGDISSTIQENIEKAGFSVIRELAGHGIGKKLHEDPAIACFGKKGSGEMLLSGMVLCVEVMYMEGSPLLKLGSDKWTISTKDKKLSAMFEDMVLVKDGNPEVLTR